VHIVPVPSQSFSRIRSCSASEDTSESDAKILMKLSVSPLLRHDAPSSQSFVDSIFCLLLESTSESPSAVMKTLLKSTFSQNVPTPLHSFS
jgi:hypothetical protein